MDRAIRDKMKNGNLTDADVRRIVDWQLSLEAERIDHQLIRECLLFLYPTEPGLSSELQTGLWAGLEKSIGGRRGKRGYDGQHRRRYPARTLLIALLLIFMAGAAIAAVLGVFDRFIGNPMNEMSSERLRHLSEAAEPIGRTVEIFVPEMTTPPEAEGTDYEQIAARQRERRFELTMDQVYCDGNNLYYSYELRDPGHVLILGEGVPTGFDEWEDAYPGETARELRWLPGETQEEMQRIADWLCRGGARYAIVDHIGMGDGASIDDGSEKGLHANILDGNSIYPDEYTTQGFQQVELPEGYVPGETIGFLMPVSYRTHVIYQDETGVYMAAVRDLRNRGFLHVPVTAAVGGKPEEIAVTQAFEEYTAQVQLAVSDVDIGGDVYIEAPQIWIDDFLNETMHDVDTVYSYVLVADGVEYRNMNGGWGIDRDTGRWHVMIRYDLPESAQSLVLVPERYGRGLVWEEAIVIR